MKRMRSLLAVLFVLLLALSQTMCGGGGGGGAEITTTPSDTTAPSRPTGLTARAISTSQINLTWSESTDNVGVAGYKVSCVYQGGAHQKLATTTSYSDTGLSADTQYCYTVSAFDAAGNESPQSAQVCATTFAPWKEVKFLGTGEDDVATGIAVDSEGNVYVTGYSKGDLNDPSKPAKSHNDIFLIKYDPTGNKQWVKMRDLSPDIALDPGSDDFAMAVAVDKNSSSIYVAGYTETQKDRFIFLVKYDSAGNWQWTQTKSITGYDFGRGVAVNSKGEIFVTGDVTGESDNADLFLIKYDSSGKEQWTQPEITNLGGTDIGKAIAIDKSDNIYVTGDTSDTTTGVRTIILAKYKDDPESSKRLIWYYPFAIKNFEFANGIALDGNGNIFITGDNVTDIVLIKIDSENGEEKWHRLYDSVDQKSERGLGVAVGNDGYVYITGWTEGKLKDDIDDPKGQAIFLIKLDPSNGDMVWARQLDNEDDDSGVAVAVDGSGEIFITGYTKGNIDKPAMQMRDIFIAKYDSDGVLQQ